MKTRPFSLALIAALFSIGILASCNSDNDPVPVTPPSNPVVKTEKNQYRLKFKGYEFANGGYVSFDLNPRKTWIACRRSDIDVLEKKLYDAGINASLFVQSTGNLSELKGALDDASDLGELCWTTIRTDEETAYSFPEVISAVPFFSLEHDIYDSRYLRSWARVYLKSGISFEEYQNYAHEMGLLIIGLEDGGYVTFCSRESKCDIYELFDVVNKAGFAEDIFYFAFPEAVKVANPLSRELILDGEFPNGVIPLDGKYIVIDEFTTQDDVNEFFAQFPNE